MSPEQRAAEAQARFRVRELGGHDVALVAAAIRDAVAAERGRCARLLERVLEEALEVGTCGPECVEFCEAFGCSTLRDLAAAIREGREP
jgi:hypothetical protein